MRIKEWIFLFIVSGLGIALANAVGFKVPLLESLPGILILLAISLGALILKTIIPLKLPIVAYCSILGLILASPISPVDSYIIDSVNKINFTAPLTIVGAFAGISIGHELKEFKKQGLKMIAIGLLVMTGTFLGSAVISNVVLKLTNTI